MIRKLRDNCYEVRGDVYDPATGRRRQVRRRFRTRTEAAAFDRSLAAGENVTRGRDVPTFGAYAQGWLAAHRAMVGLANNTCRNYAAALNVLGPYMGSVRIDRVTASRIEAAYAALLAGRRASTVRQIHIVVRMVLERAVRDGFLQANPADRVEMPRLNKAEPDVPDAARLREILAGAEGTPWFLPVYLMAVTGMRVGEVLGLQWDMVDLPHGTVTVSRQVLIGKYSGPGVTPIPGTSRVLAAHTKTRSVRTVSIPPRAVAILQGTRAAQLAAGLVTPWVVAMPDGRPMTHTYINNHLPEGVHPHSLRHAHASLLIDAGIPIPEVSRRLGHASPAVTVSTYIHAVKEQDARAADAISQAIDDTNVDTRHTP